MPFRFVHTADVHLDSPLRSLALRDADLAARVGEATRQAFANIIDLCLEERVDALIVAGDLYDGDQTSMKTALFLAGQLQRLDEAGIRVFIVRGNHDAESRITRELALPDNAKAFRGRGEAVEIERPPGAIPVAVHGVSFAKPHAPESLVPKFRAPVPDAFNIGLLHTSLGGSPDHDDYAPCSVSDLVDTGFDYWCLGHIHKREAHRERPHVVMPGMPQGRHIGEAGPKSATLVHVADDGAVVECAARPTNVVQFERASVDLAGVEEPRDMARRMGETLERLRAGVDADDLVVRLKLTGATPLNRRLRRDPELVETEARHRAGMTGNSWIEKVEIETADPGGADRAGAIGELAAAMRGAVARSEGFREEAARAMDDIERLLPPEARGALGGDETERAATLDRLIDEGCETVLAHLRDSGGD